MNNKTTLAALDRAYRIFEKNTGNNPSLIGVTSIEALQDSKNFKKEVVEMLRKLKANNSGNVTHLLLCFNPKYFKKTINHGIKCIDMRNYDFYETWEEAYHFNILMDTNHSRETLQMPLAYFADFLPKGILK